MGAVYLGRDPELGRQVAIKVIREEVRDQEVLERFFREARAAAALRHPNIITVYASGQHEHQPYMVMEYVEGDSLGDIIRTRRTLTLADKISYIEQICAGLHFAHRAGIVHRDVKPANIMVDQEGVVRILDFGIARVEGSAMTQDGSLMGSLNYMSPEQMLGHPIDHRSDIFSVGSVAYELLCYQQAFKGGLTDGLLQRLPHEDPPLLAQLYPGLPPALDRAVMRALEKEPDKRFQDLAEMRSAIVGGGAGGHADPQPEDDRTMVIPRPGAPQPEQAINLVTGPERFAQTTAAPAPHLPAPDPTSAPALTPAPPPQALQLKKEAAGSGRPLSGGEKPAAPSVPPRAAVVGPPPPQTAPRASSRKRTMVIGSAVGALVLVAAIAIIGRPPPPSDLERERPGIEETMGRFRVAYRNRNLEGVMGVFPTLPGETRQAMQRSFDDCLVYEVTFADMQVELDPTDATLKRFSNRPCTTWGGRGTSARTDAGGPMRAYSMDLRERALLDSDAGMTAAEVAAKYRVSGSWVRLLKQRRRDTGEVAPRVQRHGRRCMLEPHLHTLAALIAAHPDRTLAELKDALATPASVPTVWRAVRALGLTVKKHGPPVRTRSA